MRPITIPWRSNPSSSKGIEMGSNEPSVAQRQTGSIARFDNRWRLVGAGISNVWRFGDLQLSAASGRLLFRGPNGTGKTTALEALVPYLLDLNAARMSAGRARTTNLSTLMREGSAGKRRCGYAWLSMAGPAEGVWSFGVRIQYADGAAPPVRVVPFAMPGIPLVDFRLYGPGRAAVTAEQFEETIASLGGQVFQTEEDYVSHLAARLFGTPDRTAVSILASRLRQVRNPSLLGDLSPQAAAEALRESLPGVADDVIGATAEALAESDQTRNAFARDKEAADLLRALSDVWCAHATDVVGNALTAAGDAARDLRSQATLVKSLTAELTAATAETNKVARHVEDLERQVSTTRSEIEALEKRDAYLAAGRLNDLRDSASARRSAADTAARAMEATARSAATESESLRLELENIREDLEEHHQRARKADPRADEGGPVFVWKAKPRAPLRAGELIVDAGTEVGIESGFARMRECASAWRKLADSHSSKADAAALAIIDHKDVEQLETAVVKQEEIFRDALARADAEFTHAKVAEAAVAQELGKLESAVRVWSRANPRLTIPLDTLPTGDDSAGWTGRPWSSEDIEPVFQAEGELIVSTCDAWARHALTRAETIGAALRAQAQRAASDAEARREQAGVLRSQAEELRAGGLLPLPRPEWAGTGDDSIALGSVLDWKEAVNDQAQRARLEAALSAAGLLGATIADGAASTSVWRVEARGPKYERSLLDFLEVDNAHPLAETASAVLARVRVAPTADAGGDNVDEFCIGQDGTFRAGVLHGRTPGVEDSTSRSPAHIGMRQRRAAALARADALDVEGTELETQAKAQDAAAVRASREADAISLAGNSFPSREALRSTVNRRTEMTRIARETRDFANAATTAYEVIRQKLQRARIDWSERTRGRGLPADLQELVRLREQGKAVADVLRLAAEGVGGKLADRLERLLARYSPAEIQDRLSRSEGAAREAASAAAAAEAAVRVLQEAAGAAIKEVLARHGAAKTRMSSLESAVGPARDAKVEAAKAQAGIESSLAEAERRLRDEAEPQAAQRLSALRLLLNVPGVAQAVLDGDTPLDDKKLLEQVGAKLKGRRRLTVKTVLERADAAKATLSGVWSIDHGESHGDLLMFVLTYRDAAYDPVEAALYAEKLKARAEAALAASEERALREFVMGRLPSAISNAWQTLQDWVIDVNKKMRSAEASSGVGVQVRIPLRDDLPPAVRDVYQLSFKVSAAERTPEQQKRLSEALHALLSAAPGETMQEKVAAAVDIRDWVEVHYEVTRPGGKTQRWNSRTGLSGGERRLVVLAPMLAAIAAGYDQMDTKALRLVALDEVPAEVDERGREGLARYIAELDLDLICTSFQWDGCPGAWDGIDAHDLEAGPDDTVVAFPMLVRGLTAIPELTSAPTTQ